MTYNIYLLLAVFSGIFTVQAAKKPLNIVFIFSDDHAIQAISSYGSKINKTPNIDRLAKLGTVFENSFCSNSICGPSRATVLTGLHSHKNGFKQNNDVFNGSQMTFPKLLQKVGYETALIGKWHLSSDPTGFDHWEILPNQGNYYNPNLYKEGDRSELRPAKWGRRYQGYVTDVITDLSIDWLENRDQNKPFLLMCQHKAPHEPWAPPIKNLNNYDDVTIPEPETLFDDYANRSKTIKANTTTIGNFLSARSLKYVDPMNPQKLPDLYRMTPEQKQAWLTAYEPKNKKMFESNLSGKDMTRWRYQRYIKDYLRCIDSIDENVGRVLDYLEKQDLMDNTVIVYSSDQSFLLGEHGMYDKRWMFEESLKMPFIMHWPNQTTPGSRETQLIQNIDYAPTFCDIAGVTPPKTMQGTSLKKLLKNSEEKWREGIYYHYYEYPNIHNVPPHEGVRTGRYKLINFYKNDGYNLFDLEADPNELKDLSKNIEYQKIMKQMIQKLAKLRRQYDVPPLDLSKIEPILRKPSIALP